MRKAFIAVLMCAGALAACGDKQDNVIVQEAPPSDMGGGPDVAAPATTDTAQAPAAGDAATPAAGVPAPAGKPVRKAGLWQITSTGQGGGTSTLCVSNATEASQRGNAFATLGGGRGGGQRPGGPRPEGQRPGGDAARGGQGGGAGGGQGAGRGGFGGGGFGAGSQPTIARAGAGWTSTSSCTIERGETSITMSSKLTLTGDLVTSYAVKGSRTTPAGTTPVSVTATYKGACPAGMTAGDLTSASGQTRNVLQGRGGGGRQG
jgi:hypothetical protein